MTSETTLSKCRNRKGKGEWEISFPFLNEQKQLQPQKSKRHGSELRTVSEENMMYFSLLRNFFSFSYIVSDSFSFIEHLWFASSLLFDG